jgi:tRNA-specific 2-thiouridylase
MKPTTVAVAMSGGVDSLVAALLLQQAGHRVVGIHFLTGYEARSCRPVVDRYRADARMKPIADRLGIEIKTLDVSGAFDSRVVAYFTRAYQIGQTPNPCLRCNPAIKFENVLDYSRRLGARYLATGHYARVVEDGHGVFHLHKGVDSAKDQSYFLAFVTQQHLSRALFPLGASTKAAVRQTAEDHGLVPADKTESQDICFIRDGAYAEFLDCQPGFAARPGPIEDIAGNLIGEHRGLHLFTIGQRRGISCPAPEPYYVIRLEPLRNCLVVGPREALRQSGCRLRGINWIASKPTGPFEALVKLRYRHDAVACQVFPQTGGRARLNFHRPQAAVTPGQGAVFYEGTEVLGGGWICSDQEK